MIELISKNKQSSARCEYISSDEVIIKCGFRFIKCESPEIVFSKEPDIQRILKSIDNNSQTAGSDTLFYHIGGDVVCNSIKYPNGSVMDAQSVAASIINGVRTNGNVALVLAEDTKIPLRQILEKTSSNDQKFISESNDELDKMIEIVHNQLKDKTKTLERILCYARHFHLKLGGENQYRLEVPHHVDNIMERFGFVCVETNYIDLSLQTELYFRPITLSSKMGIGLIHTPGGKYHKSRGSKINKTKDIIMSNIHGSSDSNTYIKPIFDILMIFQHTPFLVCGIAPYYSLVIRPTKAGSICKGIPIESFRWIISPYEKIIARQLSNDENKIIDEEVNRCKHPMMMKRLLELPDIVC